LLGEYHSNVGEDMLSIAENIEKYSIIM